MEEIDFTPFGVEELREIQLGVLIPALQEMGYDTSEVVGARRGEIVGMFFILQNTHPEIAYKVWERQMEIVGNRERTLKAGQMKEKKARKRSNVHGAVGQVHKICERMKGAPRKEVIAECVKHGINENTAKTQYYKWAKGLAGK